MAHNTTASPPFGSLAPSSSAPAPLSPPLTESPGPSAKTSPATSPLQPHPLRHAREHRRRHIHRIQSENDVVSREIQIPRNTYRAVIEVYVSAHGDDEFWYSNPPDYYIERNEVGSY
ncbi:hypothetical protein SASPL_111966 [Salvia splendens]|uniref:Peptide N-acetyl-beta-D-glucosaminyl asparaginase amidase A N-terminal domain-containing protein n=1 Tax=Salvia splendens TaxID=180675 RepID=A0A8X8Y933_SALSN|nr:hypothetical protein SASPL_111966 [Salvia splendens]